MKDAAWDQRHPEPRCVFELVTVADYDAYQQLEQRNKSRGGSVSRGNLPENRGAVYDRGKELIEQKLLQVLYEQYPVLGIYICLLLYTM